MFMNAESKDWMLSQEQIGLMRTAAVKNLKRMKNDIPNDTQCAERIIAGDMRDPSTNSKYSTFQFEFSSQKKAAQQTSEPGVFRDEIHIPYTENAESTWRGIDISLVDQLMIMAAVEERERWQKSLDSDKVNEETKKLDRTYIAYLNTLIESIRSGTINRVKTAPFTMLYFIQEEFEKHDQQSREVGSNSGKMSDRIRQLLSRIFGIKDTNS